VYRIDQRTKTTQSQSRPNSERQCSYVQLVVLNSAARAEVINALQFAIMIAGMILIVSPAVVFCRKKGRSELRQKLEPVYAFIGVGLIAAFIALEVIKTLS
jgi:hypothetical protein